MRSPICIEGTAELLRFNDLPQTVEAAHGAFFLDEEGRIHLAGRIIQGDNELPLTAGYPFMSRAVLVQHHHRQGFARSLFAMRATAGRSRHLASRWSRFLVHV